MSLSTVATFKNIQQRNGLVRVEGEALKQLQSVLLSMLADIASVCERAGLDWCLIGGSCIGAVRHGGFIPWDDDIDLGMTREAWAAFVPLFLAEHGDRYYIEEASTTEDYELAFPRIRLRGTKLRSREDFGDGDCGVYVDVFYFDNAPNNPILRSAHCVVSLALGLGYSCRRFYAHAFDYLKLVEGDAEATASFKKKIVLGKLLSWASAPAWTRLWDRWNALCKNTKSKYLAIPVGRAHYSGETYLRSTIFPAVTCDFDGVSARIPRDSPSYLTQLYGDYMRIPELQDREVHVVYEMDLGDAIGLQKQPEEEADS